MEEKYECDNCSRNFDESQIIKIYSSSKTAYKSYSVTFYCKECYYERFIFPETE